MQNAPSNSDDIIDSRDICERISQLEVDAAAEGEYSISEREAFRAELKELEALVEVIDNYGGDKADDGVTLIRDSHFEDYAEELANDIGAIDDRKGQAPWPLYCIDWERAARDLQMDYTSVEFDGVTYWFR